LIEADYIFEQIKQDSKTDGQVITETNYIMDELKNYRDSYAQNISKCPKCGCDIIKLNSYDEDRGEMLGIQSYEHISKYGCESCSYIVK
jgi:hypothetical protein